MTTTDSYKEILYLDQIELDSALAQIEKGLRESLQKMETSTEGKKTTSGDAVLAELKASIAVLQGQLNGQYSHSTESSNSESIGQAVNIVLSDYKIERLIKVLQNSDTIGLVNDIETASDGDFILIHSSFRLTDFAFSSQLFAASALKEVMKQIPSAEPGKTNWDKDTEKGFKLMKSYSDLGNTLFKDNVLVQMDKLLSYAEKNNFRMNPGQLQQITGTNRNLFLLGIVESSVGSDKNDLDKITDIMSSGNLAAFGNMTSALSELILVGSSVAKKGDKLVKPIALYF